MFSPLVYFLVIQFFESSRQESWVFLQSGLTVSLISRHLSSQVWQTRIHQFLFSASDFDKGTPVTLFASQEQKSSLRHYLHSCVFASQLMPSFSSTISTLSTNPNRILTEFHRKVYTFVVWNETLEMKKKSEKNNSLEMTNLFWTIERKKQDQLFILFSLKLLDGESAWYCVSSWMYHTIGFSLRRWSFDDNVVVSATSSSWSSFVVSLLPCFPLIVVVPDIFQGSVINLVFG